MASYQHSSAPRGLMVEAEAVTNVHQADSPTHSSDEKIIQCADDNPRALAPGESPAEPARADMTICTPVVPIEGIPQSFSQSSWARRNARAKRLSRYIPKHIRDHPAWIHVLVILIFTWYALAIAASLTLPGLFSMVTGNAICKASNLPHFTRIKTTMTVGAVGGILGTLPCLVFVIPLGRFGGWMEEQFKERHIRSGRIPRDSTREDGHFPILLLWIPLVFFVCLPSGPIGASLNLAIPGVHELSKANVAKMSAIGGAMVAPILIIVALVTYGVSEETFWLICEVLDGSASPKGPKMFLYLSRQFEALLWLFSPVRRQVVSTSISTSV